MRTQFILFLALVFGLQGAKAQVVLQALDAPNFNIPPTVTLSGGERCFTSVYDNNYLPFSFPIIGAATWDTNVNPDGTLDTLIDYQGVITTTGTTINIPITATGNGILPAATFTTVVPAAHTEDGVSRTLELSWQDTPYTSTTTAITATVKSIGGVLNIKKLDLNAGIGSDYKGVVLATFYYPGTSANHQRAFNLRVLPGIPDKCFGLTTLACVGYGANVQEHNFLYMPVQGLDGRTWLNNNLGAEYARIGSPAFNPVQQATSLADKNAYGSHFQWGRDADGHELVAYPTATTGNRVNPSIPWYNYDQLQTYTNPCPSGYHVPTILEWKAYQDLLTSRNGAGWLADPLKLTYTGDLIYDDTWSPTPGTDEGWYWSSYPLNNISAWSLTFSDNYSTTYSYFDRERGRSLRCVKD
ncbi:hypothetical protein PG614_02220 [Riemerella anatipestifer]|nr:hypothetical protein [Riemerella anatipestifer]MDY3532689.1 hypothetical protein [Riemerella anatipestifer]MDY3534756.1 hypothetical protein [Riemerella anatipestifer]